MKMIKIKLSATHENEYPTNMTVSEDHGREMYEQLKSVFNEEHGNHECLLHLDMGGVCQICGKVIELGI